jgi:putative DNA primase/helicase
MSHYSLEGLNITAAEFLRPFFAPNETICLRVFSDKPDSAFSGQKLECELSRFEEVEKSLKSHNEQERGVYFVINYGGHEDAQITRINAQFMECDDIPLEEQLSRIQAFALEPSLIVKTRKSLHCYWLIKDGSISAFRRIQRKLVAQFGADAACVNESRVFRLPGFYHHKQEPVLIECIKYNPELRFSQAELETTLPELPDASDSSGVQAEIPPHSKHAPEGSGYGSHKGLALVGRRCLFIQHCKKDAKTLSEPDWYAMITNLAVFEGGAAAIHKLSKPYAKYSERGTQTKIDHFLKSGTKPMTCAKIAGHGFICPRHTDGSCDCKSPASFAFKPPGIDEIRKALSAYKVKKSPAEDIATALAYVHDWLFNVEIGVAAAFINSEVKERFGLKADDAKRLVAAQKDLYKAYSSEVGKRTDKKKMPPWYEVNENGVLKFLPGVLADHCAQTEHVFYCADSYYFYDHGVYSPQNDKTAQRRVRQYMNSRYATANDIRDAEWQWQVLVDKTVREINVNPYLLNFKNTLYNVLDDTLIEHDPKYYTTVQFGGNYDPAAQCPRFIQFLSETLPESEADLLQEIFGYLLVPVNKAQKSFVLTGAANAGKSTVLAVVQDIMLGADNVSNIPWQSLSERFRPAELFGKLANVFADLPSKSIEDSNIFKAITGSDYITGERKHKDTFSFKPTARLLFSCNEIPRNYGDRSDGFYRRLILIRFSKSVPEDKRDPDLTDKLAAEADGILMWALAGLKRLMANNYRFGETSRTKKELNQYRIENNSVLAFIDECCAVDDKAVCLRDEMFLAYQEYCKSNGLKPVSQIKFNRDMEGADNGIEKADEPISRRRIWKGVRVI